MSDSTMQETMAKVCLNCSTRNTNGRVRCKECGASLVRALEVKDGPNLVPLFVVLAIGVLLILIVWGPFLVQSVFQ